MNGHFKSTRSILKSVLIFGFLLISFFAFAQGRQAALNEIGLDYQAYRKEADVRILNHLKNNPSEKITFYRNRSVYLLVDVTENGSPVYFKTENAAVATSLNVDQLRTGGSLGINMLGTGIKLGTWDGGRVRTDHVELTGRVTIGDGTSIFDDHATHTSGTMIASGINPAAKGMAPNATLIAFDFSNDVGEMTAQAKPDQSSLILSNHSYGTVCGWDNGVWRGDISVSTTGEYRFGFYDAQAQQWDQIAFNAPYYLIVKAAGNDRGESGDGSHPADGPFDCIPTFGNAKNIMTVGAVNKLTGPYTGPSSVQMTTFSSWGPTDDGRIKPDIVAPGMNVFSSTASTTSSYAIENGTSMATPAVTGTLVLLQQLYKSLNSGNLMRSATLKALAIHTAREAGANPGPDYSNGWGLLDAEAAAKIIINKDNQNIFMLEATLVSGQTFEINLGTPKPSTNIKATLVWTDPAGTPNTPILNNPAKKLVNDLDLRMVEAGGTTNLPWVLNPASPSAAATTGDNTRDNVEKLEYAFSPTEAGSYKIRVTNKGTLQGGTQSFSLILEYSSAVDPLTTYYWIGDGGSWEDRSHWSLTSGGVAANTVPTAANRVVFDDKSFSLANATVSLNQDQSIASLRWFGKQFPVNLSMNGHALTISTYMTMLTDQISTPTPGTINFVSTATAPVAVDLNSSILDRITLNFNSSSSWAVTGAASVDKIILAQGSVAFNGSVLRLNQLTSTGTGSLSFTTSSFQALQNLAMDFTGATILSDNSSSIIVSPAVTNSLNFSSLSFQGLVSMQGGDVSITGTGQVRSIQGNGIVRLNGHLLVSNLNLSGGSQLVLQQGSTQTFTDKIVFATSSSSRVTIKSSTASKAFFALSNYYKICVDNIDVQNVDVDIANNSVVNAGLGGTLTNSSNWLNIDCSNLLFPDFTLSYLCVKASTYFTDASSGPITSRTWSFGDPGSTQNSSTLVSPVHYYATAGPFTATLTVNGASGSRSISKQVVLAANDLADNTIQFNNGNLISTVVAQGYQWLKDGQIVTGATSRSFTYGTAAEYSVLTFSNTCNKRSTPLLITGVEELVSPWSGIKIYPNPTSDFLQIESAHSVLATAMVDAVGREVRLEAEPMNEGRYRLNVTAIPSGLYILRVLTTEKVEMMKVIIRK